MTARMKNPAMLLPDAMTGIQNIYKAMYKGGVPGTTMELVHLRASQINGCSACIYGGIEARRRTARPTSGCTRWSPGASRSCSPTPSALPWR